MVEWHKGTPARERLRWAVHHSLSVACKEVF